MPTDIAKYSIELFKKYGDGIEEISRSARRPLGRAINLPGPL
jgi:hypothetical protein